MAEMQLKEPSGTSPSANVDCKRDVSSMMRSSCGGFGMTTLVPDQTAGTLLNVMVLTGLKATGLGGRDPFFLLSYAIFFLLFAQERSVHATVWFMGKCDLSLDKYSGHDGRVMKEAIDSRSPRKPRR